MLSGGYPAAPGEVPPTPGGIDPGLFSTGRSLDSRYHALRAAVSLAVLALWQAPESHCRLSRLLSSPGMMWSQSVPMPLHPFACCLAWHLPFALALTAALIRCQSWGSRSRLCEVCHLLRLVGMAAPGWVGWVVRREVIM